jgi:hypothetical protein
MLAAPLRRHACDCAFHDLQQRLLKSWGLAYWVEPTQQNRRP